jgi:hypothetical protein
VPLATTTKPAYEKISVMQINTTIIIANDGVLNEDEETFAVAAGGEGPAGGDDVCAGA